jgi:hypothetical protein
MKVTRDSNYNKTKRLCIYITKEVKKDGSATILQDEIGDGELKKELEKDILKKYFEKILFEK